MRQLSCPGCGGPLHIESLLTTILVCPYCGQSLYIRDSGVDLTGKTAKLADFPSRLAIGAEGKIKDLPFKVLGRVRYQYAQGFWDEWFLQMASGQVSWVEEDEGEFTLTHKTKLTAPIPPFADLRVGGFIPLGQDRLFISEKGEARLVGAEGELAMVASPGQAIHYIDGTASSKALRLMITETGITLHTGEPLEFNDITVN